MILEQGLALDELVGTKNSIEREAQGESGGEQSPPAAGAAGRDAVPYRRRKSPMECASARMEGDIPAEVRKYSSSQSPATGECYLAQGRRWGATTTHDCPSSEQSVPPPSNLSDSDGVAAHWEGDAAADAGEYSSGKCPTMDEASAGSLVGSCRNPTLVEQETYGAEEGRGMLL